jgi:hypothetical protein
MNVITSCNTRRYSSWKNSEKISNFCKILLDADESNGYFQFLYGCEDLIGAAVPRCKVYALCCRVDKLGTKLCGDR